MYQCARLNKSSGESAYFKFRLLRSWPNVFRVRLFPINATLEQAIRPHENRARNVSRIRGCFLHLEHNSPYPLQFGVSSIPSLSEQPRTVNVDAHPCLRV